MKNLYARNNIPQFESDKYGSHDYNILIIALSVFFQKDNFQYYLFSDLWKVFEASFFWGTL